MNTSIHKKIEKLEELMAGADALREDIIRELHSQHSGPRPLPLAKAPAASRAVAKRKKRAVVTDATRAQVKKLSEAGKTVKQIAKEVRISMASAQGIKKALGLVKARK